jgi:hypothetical protein
MAPTAMDASPSRCPRCGAALAADQRYCLGCGLRVCEHRVPPPALVSAASAEVAAVARARAARRLPSPRTAAALVLTTLGVGTLAGSTASAPGPLAGAPVIAMAPAATPVATATPTPLDGAALIDDGGSPAAAPAPAPQPAAAAAATAEPEPVAQAASPTPTPTPTPEPTATPTPAPEATQPKHVVIVSLTGHDASAFLWDSPAQYLAHELASSGVLMRGFRADGSLAANLPVLEQELTDAALTAKEYGAGVGAAPLDALEADLADTAAAPALAYVVPDPCHDGREGGDCPGEPPLGLSRADAWLHEWVPKITASEAFADDGLLVVLFDGGGLPAPAPDAEPPAVGAIMVSPLARRGQQPPTDYDGRSVLRLIAGAFGVEVPVEDGIPFGRDALRSQVFLNSDTDR